RHNKPILTMVVCLTRYWNLLIKTVNYPISALLWQRLLRPDNAEPYMATVVSRTVIPGFGLTLGFSVFYLSLLFLLPVAGLLIFTLQMSWADFWQAISHPQVVASYKLSFGASLTGATINAIFGSLTAWVLVRYRFPGIKVVDALVDLPFALPT